VNASCKARKGRHSGCRARRRQLLRQQLLGRQSSRHCAAASDGLKAIRLRHGIGALYLRHPGDSKLFEGAIARFLGKDDAVLYSSCWDANGGLFEPSSARKNAVISDELNHPASSTAVGSARRRVSVTRIATLPTWSAACQAKAARFRTDRDDGVFSMDARSPRSPTSARWPTSTDALVMVDDSHAPPASSAPADAVGRRARLSRTHRHHHSTLGKTLGGAAGGFTCGAQGTRRLPAPALPAVLF